MKITRAQHYGMCFGVRDAISLAKAQTQDEPLTILGDLVHNEQVMADLKNRGVTIERDVNEIRTKKVMITAHGASNKRIREVEAKGFQVIEATCPLVRHAHNALGRLVSQGYFPVIIGQGGHVEVKGMTEDLEEYSLIEEVEEVKRLPQHPKYGVVAQTTQPIQKVREIVERMRQQFPGSQVKFSDTVCRPTKDRQIAAETLAKECDIVIVVGGKNSNNTRQLVIKSQSFGAKAYHVQGPEELDGSWFSGYETVGITAGTSTPSEIVDAVEEELEAIASRLSGRGAATEFAVPAMHAQAGLLRMD